MLEGHGRDALSTTFERLKTSDRRAFIPYFTAGHPKPAATVEVLEMLAGEGADVIELGVPFSDPLADGPTIQRAARRALGSGVDVAQVLRWTDEFSRRSGTPIVIFSYLNPILRYGPKRFVSDAVTAGAAGLLITDLPVGADPALEQTLGGVDIDLVRLVAPTTPADRAALIVESGQGFIYYISRTGVTGERKRLRQVLADEVAALRELTNLPIAVGFGISTAEQARAVAAVADGVVVGSALVRLLAEDGIKAARGLARELRKAIDEAV